MTDVQTIVCALKGRIHGRNGLCFCPAHHNTRTPALSVSQGDDGRLLLHCFAGCSFDAILGALRGLGLVEGRGHYAAPSAADLAKIREAEKAEVEKKARQARAIWGEAVPIDGTLAETYLRNRSITAPLPATLRFHPECWHGPTARRRPAMVALIEDGDTPAIHRTFLRPDGSGKADVPEGTAKLMLGSARGGHVQLTKAEGPLVVSEGIETGLALASGLLRTPATIWASLSTSGMSGLHLPDKPGRLVVAMDGDEPGTHAGKALAMRATAQGWTVSLLPAPLHMCVFQAIVGSDSTG